MVALDPMSGRLAYGNPDEAAQGPRSWSSSCSSYNPSLANGGRCRDPRHDGFIGVVGIAWNRSVREVEAPCPAQLNPTIAVDDPSVGSDIEVISNSTRRLMPRFRDLDSA